MRPGPQGSNRVVFTSEGRIVKENTPQTCPRPACPPALVTSGCVTCAER